MFEESASSLPSIWASVNSWFTPAVLFVLLNLMIGTIAITSSISTQKQQNQQQQPQEQKDPQQQQPQPLARSPSILQRLKSINLYSHRSSQEANPAFEYEKSQEIDSHYIFKHIHEPEQLQIHGSPSVIQDHNLKPFNLESYGSQETNKPEYPDPNFSENLESEAEPQIHYDFEQLRVVEDEQEQGEDEHTLDRNEEQSLDEIYSNIHGGQVARTMSDTNPASGERPMRLPRKMRKSASSKSAFAHFEEEDIVESRRPVTVKEGKGKDMEVDDEVDAKADVFINRFKQQLKLQRLDSIVRYKEMIGRGSGK